MNEHQAVETLRRYIEGLFPKTCPNCNRVFSSLKEYLQVTTHTGVPMSYHVEDGDDRVHELGTFSFANCPCGTTIAITSEHLEPAVMMDLGTWAASEAARRGIDMPQLLGALREQIDSQVLAAPDAVRGG